MLSFENDYSEGAHSRILKRLVSTDLQQVTGYGNDSFCEEARIRIRHRRTGCGYLFPFRRHADESGGYRYHVEAV